MGQFPSWVFDKFLAPEVSSFSQAKIPDMSKYNRESEWWVANHFLNSLLRGRYTEQAKPYAFNFLRRAEGSFAEHTTATGLTLGFLSDGSPRLYVNAILHWEFFLSQAWLAYKLLGELAVSLTGNETKRRFFERHDQSVEHRLNLFYNATKHVESRIAAGQILPDATMPVWLTNDGLKCTDAILTYEETAEVLRFISNWADSVVDPRELSKQLEEL
jgi:hypothetical protein